jgi:hypothetical protein
MSTSRLDCRCGGKSVTPPPLKPTLANVKKVLAGYGGTLERDDYPRSYRLFAYAPENHHWSDGIHGLVADIFPEKGSAAEAYEDLLERMSYGTEPCTDPNDGNCIACDCPITRRSP